MSTTTYFIEPDGNGTPTLWREPGEYGPEPVPTPVEVIDLLRSLGMEDRTRPDYSDVPVGTAGTATVNGVEGVRVFRNELAGWWLASCAEGASLYRHDSDHAVTDFTPDVVVDDEMVERIANIVDGAYHATNLAHLGNKIHEARRILRGTP